MAFTPPFRVGRLLHGSAIYRHLRYSKGPYQLYLRLINRGALEAGRAERLFYRKLLAGLKPSCLIFDIGANRGFKTEVFLDLEAQVVAVEPDRSNAELLRWRFKRKPVWVVEKAVSDCSKVAAFHVLNDASAKNTLSGKWKNALEASGEARFGEPHRYSNTYPVQTTTLDELISTFGLPSFVKIDVEGLELEVLRGLHQKIPFMQFEVNLPEFRGEALESISVLEALDPGVRFNYSVGKKLALEAERWLTAPELRSFLNRSGCSFTRRALEVFASMETQALGDCTVNLSRKS